MLLDKIGGFRLPTFASLSLGNTQIPPQLAARGIEASMIKDNRRVGDGSESPAVIKRHFHRSSLVAHRGGRLSFGGAIAWV
jgi:hypothetical protein